VPPEFELRERDWEVLELSGSWLKSELSSVEALAVVSLVGPSHNRDDPVVDGMVEHIDIRDGTSPIGWTINGVSLVAEDECSDPRALHLVLSLDVRSTVSSLCRLVADDASWLLRLRRRSRSVSPTRKVTDGERLRLNIREVRSGGTSFIRKSSSVLLVSAVRLSSDWPNGSWL